MRVRFDEWSRLHRVVARWLRPRARRPAAGSPAELRVLALVPEGDNRQVLQALVRDTGWSLSMAESFAEWGAEHSDVPPIVIYDRELSPGRWRETIRLFANQSPRPHIILLSSNSDTNLFDELYRAGGSEIVRSPIDPAHLLWAVIKAWQLWRTQQSVRAPLAVVTK